MQYLRFLLLAVLIFGSLCTDAQLNIIFKENKAFISVDVDKKSGKISIDELPASIVLNFPDENAQNFKLQFNKDSLKFFVGFGCSGDSCVKLMLSDVKENNVTLNFLGNKLVAIGNRYIEPREILLTEEDETKPYVALPRATAAKKEDEPKDMYSALDTGTFPQSVLDLVSKEAVEKLARADTNQFFCGSIVCAKCYNNCDSLKKHNCTNSFFCCEHQYDLYHKVWEKNEQFYAALKNGKATPKYWIVYDTRDARSVVTYYFKIHNSKDGTPGFLEVKRSISPAAKKHAMVSVLGNRDSIYTVDGNRVDQFLEQESKVEEVLKGIKPGAKEPEGAGGEKTEEPPATPPNENPQGDFDPSLNLPFIGSITLRDASIKLKQIDSMSSFLDKGNAFNNLSFYLNLRTGIRMPEIIKESLTNTPSDSARLKPIFDEYVGALRQILDMYLRIETLQKEVTALAKKDKKNQQTIDNLRKEIDACKAVIAAKNRMLAAANKEIERLKKSLVNKPVYEEWYMNLKALERDLEKFNAEYDDISFIEKQYKADLVCLQLKIKSALGITTVQTSKGLAEAMIDRVKSMYVDTMFFKAFARIIRDVEFQYGLAIGKKAKYGIFSSSKKVPNADEFVINVRTQNVTTPFVSDTFHVSWGLKIDFSTGFFLNRLSAQEFALSQHTFQYKETRDSITPTGEKIVLYTGLIKTGTGNLIHSNDPRLSYSAGFLVHVYPRTGGFVNTGLVTGITINNSNSSPVQLMLGLSTMFSTGKSSRVSLVGGLTWGQVKKLSSAVEPYVWDRDRDPDNRLYNSINDMPRFYTGSSDLLTYNKWSHCWFFGVTYNFASLNIGK